MTLQGCPDVRSSNLKGPVPASLATLLENRVLEESLNVDSSLGYNLDTLRLPGLWGTETQGKGRSSTAPPEGPREFRREWTWGSEWRCSGQVVRDGRVPRCAPSLVGPEEGDAL